MKRQTRLLTLCFAVAWLQHAHSQDGRIDVREFVRAEVFPHSYAELSASYDASVVPQLVEMLNSPAQAADHGRIAALLGIVGDERAADALITFLERPVEPVQLTDEEEDARKWALTGLGYLANRNVSQRALNYLIEGLTPSVWRQRNVTGIPRWASSYDEYDRQLSTQSLFGLALSGRPEAERALRSLRDAPTLAQARFRNGLDDTLNQWLGVHAQVAARGLAGAYEQNKADAEIEQQRWAEEAKRAREERAEERRLRDAQNPR